MTLPVLAADDEADIETLFRRQFRRDLAFKDLPNTEA
jgi:hypothetical protein